MLNNEGPSTDRFLYYTGYNFSPIPTGIVYVTALVAIFEVTPETFN